MKRFFLITILLTSTVTPILVAQSEEPSKMDGQGLTSEISGITPSQGAQEKILERITVVGNEGNISSIPGAAALITGEKLEEAKTGVGDISRALRTVPGVNIVEEDGFGLRPNIGMRGSPSERSSSITLMEDGVLISPAPYSAPAAYFFPTFGRMSGMEVVKGAGQIKYGPRTIGGSLNLLSTEIPTEFKAHIDASAGSYNTEKAHIYVGDSGENAGYLLETYQMYTDGFKNLDGGGDTGFDLQDYLAKFRLNTDKTAERYQQLELKLGTYDQSANETYLGLSKDDFEKTPNRRYAGSQRDKVDVEQQQYSLRHYAELSDDFDITTTGYYNSVRRRWNKLDSVNGSSLSSILDNPAANQDAFSWISGAANSPADALSMRDADRDYYSEGIQSVMVGKVTDPIFEHRLELGVRHHRDEEDRKHKDDLYQMLNGTMVQTTAGAPLSSANKISSAEATAVYLQDTLSVDSWRFIPGLRYENIDLYQRDYGKNDPTRSGVALTKGDTSINTWIPGIGAEYTFSETVTGFTGVHKGFSPPGPTTKEGIKEEESISYEVGANIRRNTLQSQVAFFYNDYDNLLGVDTLSSGGSGTGDPFNLGAAHTYGVEASMSYDIAENFEVGYKLPIYATYTFTNAEFDSSFKSDNYGNVTKGDQIPYIAPNQFAVGAGIDDERYGKLLFRSYYVESMLTQPSSNGTAPSTDSYFVLDAHVESPEIKKGMRLFMDVTNVLDQEYIVAWRPAGARPGAPRTALAGVKLTF